MIVKYLRVSTTKQDITRQDMQLDKLKISFDREYVDKITGKTKDRPQLNKMLCDLKNGDILYCESISRLGRSLKDLIEIIEQLVNKGVRVIIVKEGIDTNSSTYKLLLAVFGGVAEMERETIQERVIQGIEKCKATGETKTGIWFGRKEKQFEDLPKNFRKYYIQMKNKQITKVEMAKLLECGRATLYRWITIYEKHLLI
ncbi:recombinase family protein [Clostridium perfringens]|uniref:Transposon Tn21 resolvase n=1 Tax=Clostridium perfringens TaxID=1502 RepID=A0A2X3C3Z2_CLOPF|nr:recombinase family protein [Clostridium perfringens]MBI6080890.1 recombinase family protein [Clostridium perfringens]MDH2473158.1 recombinase family protein [Clostridium perfringens]MDK0875363.1 recombinase family protein [Clostridium perfringens]MDM0962091.1 recombinase family protein [Clostridium perfringens]NGT65815.1 recombinase family protein [Clostridium perfringens]